MRANTDNSQITPEAIKQMLSVTIPASRTIDDYIPEKLAEYLSKKLHKAQNVQYFLDKYLTLAESEKEVVIKFFEQDHISCPQIETVLDALKYYKIHNKGKPITDKIFLVLLHDYLTMSNKLRSKLLACYKKATPDIERRLDVAVRYCMLDVLDSSALDYKRVVEKVKNMELH